MQPLQAPAGAGKTHSLQALRAAAHRAGKDVLVLAPTGKAVDEAMHDGAGDRGLTVAKALHLIDDDELTLDRRTVIVVDEASMVATPELQKPAVRARRTGAGQDGARRRRLSAGAGARPAAACSSSSATTCPGRSASPRCGGCATPTNATPHWRCGPGTATGYAKRSAGTAPTTACTPVTRSRWPPTPLDAYLADRADGQRRRC